MPTTDVQISIIRSQIFAECQAQDLVETQIPDLRNTVEELCRAYLDFFGLIEGSAYSMELTSLVRQDIGDHTVLGHHYKELTKNLATLHAELLGGDVSHLAPAMALALSDGPMQRALADARLAITEPAYTAMYCYRGIEHLRTHFQGDGASASKTARANFEKKMLQALNIEKECIDLLRQLGDRPRHGVITLITWDQRLTSMRLLWAVIDRYALYRMTGATPPSPLTIDSVK